MKTNVKYANDGNWDTQDVSIDQKGAQADTCFACLAQMMRFNGFALDETVVRNMRGKAEADLDCNDIIVIAQMAGFKARLVSIDANRLGEMPLPAVALKNDGSFTVIAKFDERKGEILLYDPDVLRLVVVGVGEFLQSWSGKLILMILREGTNYTINTSAGKND